MRGRARRLIPVTGHSRPVARVHDLESPELSALLGLLDDHEPLNMRAFSVAARVSPATARGVLDKLRTLGAVTVQGEERGATKVLSISLTPLGRALATHVREMDALLARRR